MKKQSTQKGFAVLSFAGIAVKVISLVYLYFLINILGSTGYAVYMEAYQIYVFVFVLTNSGIPVAISKLISELFALGYYKDAVKSFRIARKLLFILGIVMSIVMFILARPLTRAMNVDRSYLSIMALAPAIILTSISSVYRGYFQGRENMTPTAVSQIIEQIANAVFTIVFAAMFIKYGIEKGCAGGTIGTTAGSLLSVIYLITFYRKNNIIYVPKGYKRTGKRRFTNAQLLKKIINYGLPITISVGMTYAGNLVDLANTISRLMAGGFSKDQATILYGSLSKYQQLMNVPIAIITSLAAAVLPAIASAGALKNREAVIRKVKFAFKVCFLIAVPSAFGLSILSKQIFTLVFSRRYIGGSTIMLYGSSILIFMSIVQIQISILQGMGKLYTATLYSALGITAKIVTNYFLISIPGINIYGTIIGSAVGFTVTIVLNSILMVRSLKISPKFFTLIFKPILSSCFMNIIIFFIVKLSSLVLPSQRYIANMFIIFVCVVVGIYSYLLSTIILGGINKSDVSSLPNKFLRFIPRWMLCLLRN